VQDHLQEGDNGFGENRHAHPSHAWDGCGVPHGGVSNQLSEDQRRQYHPQQPADELRGATRRLSCIRASQDFC